MTAKQHLTSFLEPHKEIYSGGGNDSNSAKHHVSNKYILFDAPETATQVNKRHGDFIYLSGLSIGAVPTLI